LTADLSDGLEGAEIKGLMCGCTDIWVCEMAVSRTALPQMTTHFLPGQLDRLRVFFCITILDNLDYGIVILAKDIQVLFWFRSGLVRKAVEACSVLGRSLFAP
jgi:hypothetical protein